MTVLTSKTIYRANKYSPEVILPVFLKSKVTASICCGFAFEKHWYSATLELSVHSALVIFSHDKVIVADEVRCRGRL